MSITSETELRGMERIGGIVAHALASMERAIEPGVTTATIDAVCRDVLRQSGAAATPQAVYGFPGSACISVNDEVVHGVPGERVIDAGDIVKIDVTADRDGFIADAARTVVVAPVDKHLAALRDCARSAFDAAMRVVRAGARIREIGRVIESEIHRCGFEVVRDLCGHGVGRAIHEPPTIPNHDVPGNTAVLAEGHVITVEPIVTTGGADVFTAADGWTLCTTDRSLAAHFEETLVVTRGAPIILTASAAAA